MKSLLFLPIFLISFLSLAQSFVETQKIVSQNRTFNGEFGRHISLDGDYAIVGVPLFSENNIPGSGIAYLYERNQLNEWELKQNLLPQNVQEGENFGYDVDIKGDYALISARQFNGNGAAYIFKRNTQGVWNEIQVISAPIDNVGNFGVQVSIDDTFLAISSYNYKVYIYKKDVNDVWNFIQSVQDFNTVEGAFGNYGSSLELKGNTLIVGDSDELNNDLYSSGAIYFYERDINDAWNEVQKITPGDRISGAGFGTSLSINDTEDVIVIGAPTETYRPTLLNQGGAYVFNKDNNGVWNEQQRLESTDYAAFKEFGQSVSINNGTIVVGSPYVDYEVSPGYNIFQTGAIYTFSLDINNIWNETDKIYPSDTNSQAFLGYTIDFDENTILSGALNESYDENDLNFLSKAGAVYFYQDSSTLSIQDSEELGNIKLYPNPTTGAVNLKFKNSSNHGKVILRNVLGQQIQSSEFNNTNELKFNIVNPSGIYILEVYINESKKKVFRIIKS